MYSWEKNIRTVEPYVPGEQPKETNIIKLNTNENPYGPSPRIASMKLDTDFLNIFTSMIIMLNSKQIKITKAFYAKLNYSMKIFCKAGISGI